MIPAWHQLVPISGHVEESDTAENCNYTRLPSKHLCQLDYSGSQVIDQNSILTVLIHNLKTA